MWFSCSRLEHNGNPWMRMSTLTNNPLEQAWHIIFQYVTTAIQFNNYSKWKIIWNLMKQDFKSFRTKQHARFMDHPGLESVCLNVFSLHTSWIRIHVLITKTIVFLIYNWVRKKLQWITVHVHSSCLLCYNISLHWNQPLLLLSHDSDLDNTKPNNNNNN